MGALGTGAAGRVGACGAQEARPRGGRGEDGSCQGGERETSTPARRVASAPVVRPWGGMKSIYFDCFCASQNSPAGWPLISSRPARDRSTSASRSARKSTTSCLSGIPLSGVRSDTRVS